MTIVDFLRLTRVNLWRLVLATVVGACLAYGYTKTLPVIYEADASGYVSTTVQSGTPGEVMSNSVLANAKVVAFEQLIDTRAVWALALKEMGSEADASSIAGRVRHGLVAGSPILRVWATSTSPQEAHDLANAIMVALAQEANRIELGGTVKPGQQAIVKIIPIEPAELPGGPISPNVRKYVLQGAMGGLGLAYVLVFLRRMLDTRIRTVKDVEDNAGTNVLGIVPVTPELREKRGRGRLGNLGLAAEAFRQMRTNLRFVNVDEPPRSIVVTSASAGEGKSTMSATLARVLGEAGQPTIVIDADLRRPMLGTIFDRQGSVGLSQVLSGQIPLAEAIQDTDQENVGIITAGRVPPNPSELLGSRRMHALIDELTKTHLVILDAPPLLPVTDAGLLTAMCDGAVLVFAVGKTHKEQAKHCAKIMGQINGRILGSILNLAPKKGVGAVVYGYGYGYGSYKSQYYTNNKYAKRQRSEAEQAGRRSRRRSAKESVDA